MGCCRCGVGSVQERWSESQWDAAGAVPDWFRNDGVESQWGAAGAVSDWFGNDGVRANGVLQVRCRSPTEEKGQTIEGTEATDCRPIANQKPKIKNPYRRYLETSGIFLNRSRAL